jgi:hypothetical protein
VQELGLQRQRELGDLVQVDRAPLGVLELAGLPAVRPGEGALLVAEELGLEQAVRNRGAIDLDERPVAASRVRMDGAGDEVFPDAALAPDQDCRVRVRDVLDDRPDGLHLRASVHQRDALSYHRAPRMRSQPLTRRTPNRCKQTAIF